MKKKLLVVVPNLQLGGQERVAVNTAEIMSHDFEVVIVTFNNVNPIYECPCKLIDFQIQVKNSIVGKVLNVVLRSIKLNQVRNKVKADYCLSFGQSANLVNCLSGGVGKTITSIRGYANIGETRLDKLIYKRSDRIVCCSEEMCYRLGEIVPKLKEKIHCLYNPYDIEKIRELGEERVDDYFFSPHTIVSHGRLEYVKGYDRLIKAFVEVKREITDAKLLIIGEGSERNRLENLSSEYGVSDSVALIGMRKNPFKYLAKSTLYVLSSRNEGFPNSLVEGMCFLPVVAVDCKSGPKEIINDSGGCGLLISENDVDEPKKFASILIEVMDSCLKEKLFRGAKERVTIFNNENYRNRLIHILEM